MRERFFAGINEALIMTLRIRRGRRSPRLSAALTQPSALFDYIIAQQLAPLIHSVIYVVTKFRFTRKPKGSE